jgi:hypothetical protein
MKEKVQASVYQTIALIHFSLSKRHCWQPLNKGQSNGPQNCKHVCCSEVPLQFFYCVAGKNQITKLQEEVRDCNTKMGQLSLRLEKQDSDIVHLREEVNRSSAH